jgi:hypothetical protein
LIFYRLGPDAGAELSGRQVVKAEAPGKRL